MNYEDLLKSVRSAAGLRLRLKLQPMYGEGEIIFPPTYAGGGYLIASRRIPGFDAAVPCAVIDSVQSQANRMEDALAEDIRSGALHLPHVATDFSSLTNLPKPIGKITSLETPHRIFDAIIRDSMNDQSIGFPYTEAGKAVVKASSKNAANLFRYDPTSLLFGSWDSTGISGGLGEKFTRCVVSELVAVDVERATRKGTRVDPLNASKHVGITRNEKDKLQWEVKGTAGGKEVLKPSELNHGSVPWDHKEMKDQHGGVSCRYIQQSTTISFPALRQLRFPLEGKDEPERNAKAHAVLAAIALHAAALNVSRGWHLRSRCDLELADGQKVEWEILGTDGKQSINADVSRKILTEAIAAARKAGLPWEEQPLLLRPSSSLAALVKASQELQRKEGNADD